MSNWISHKAQYFKKNGDIDRKKECTCFLLDTINSDLYEVVHAAFYCNVYYAAVVQTKIFNDQEYKEIPKEEQEITAMVIDTKTEKKEFIYLNLEKESDMPIRRECPKIILNLLSDTDDENSQEWRKQCHKSLQIKRKLLKLDGLPEGTRIQFPSLLSFSNGVEKGDSIILLKSNRKWMLHGYVWKPECKPVGVIQVIHGMTEYIGRYEEFAAHFTDLGYVVCGFDLESHGKSIPIHHKDSGLYIHCWDDLIADVEMIRIKIRRQYPEIPYVMLGFSLGSFVLRSHQCIYPKTADKLIYIGTGQPKMNELKFAHWIVKTLCKKDNKPSKLVKKLAFDNYNRKFKHSKNGIDWLLKDEKAQEDYLSDKRVVMDMTPRFFLQFLNGMMKIQSNEYWLYYKNDVLFIAGEEDPVSCGLSEVLKRYRRAGARITKKIISGYRHDVLHDSCKEKVFQCIEKFL